MHIFYKNKNPTVKTLNLLITTISLVMICLNVRIDDWIIGLKINWNFDGLLNKRGRVVHYPPFREKIKLPVY